MVKHIQQFVGNDSGEIFNNTFSTKNLWTTASVS